MVCASCGRAAKAGARFCGGCGAALAARCPACGAECEPDLRFCEACGASLETAAAARPAEAAAARKVVSIVFADLVGSTSLHERLDAEAVRQFMEGYYAAMRGAVEAHGGRVTQVMGDGVKAVFGAPRVAEDDAIRAVRAAVEMQRAFRALAAEQRERIGETGLRVAVNTGEVVADDASEIIGDPVNVAARLQEQGRDGDVMIGGETQRVVTALVTLAPLGSFALKGRAEPVTAWRLVSLEPPAGAAATPFVGRDEELGRLRAVYDAATRAPAARLAVLLGSPGLGKSRLLAELARQLAGRALVLTAQCDPAGGATFAPLAEALRAQLGLEAGVGDEALRAALARAVPGDDAERALIAKGIGALLSGTPALPEEIFFVVRRLLAALAAEQPVVLAIDDVQWAEPLLLDFTEHLVQWGAGIPLLVLVAARPELRDTRSSFTTAGGLVSDVVTLGGLDAGAAMRLAANVVGADTLPAAVAGRVLATSEGNPLFLRELVRMLVNDGTLQRDGERWTLAVDLAALEMPPTIQALLAARLERLRPEERLVLERAAVVGRQFSRAAVAHLLPREAQADLDARLEALRRSELVEADAGWLLGEPTLRFHHALIRDAAYRRVLRGTRAELHARFADWLEARAGESVELEETIGWHLEQAHQHLRELGPLDANGRALGERAGHRLAAAGRRALARDDLTPARSLLGRALDCLDESDPARGALALDWCEALLSAGDVGTAARALAELGRFTAGSERLRAWHTCFTSQLAALADPKALRASAEAVVAAAAALAAAGDVAGEAKAHAVHAEALARLGEIGACEAALDKALAAARRANDRRRANAVLSGAPLAALWGPSPVTRASGRCLDVVRVLRITQGAPAVEAVALRCQAVLETLRGRSDAARRMIASSRRLVEELGITQRLLEVDHSAGLIELFEGDAVAAERSLRPAYEGFRAHGLGVAAAQTAALLGRALLAQGRAPEAEALSHESEALAGDDFQAAIDWRGARALALAGRGEHAAALELARAAVEIAASTDDLLDHAAARSALAVALRAAGRGAEADAEEARAIELWEQKGATLLAERARRGAARIAPAERAPDARAEAPRVEHRRVQPNGGTLHADRLNAAIAARDSAAIPALTAAGFEAVMHPTGAVLERGETLEWWRLFFEEDRGGVVRVEPIATLGSSFALCRQSWTGTGSGGPDFDVGPYQRDSFCVIEADAQGRIERSEVFGPDRLADAIVRLYERHAERLPEGPERDRAGATARSVAIVLREVEFDLYAPAFAPEVKFVDHRRLGFPATSGAEAYLQRRRTLLELSDGITLRTDDVLGLRSDALLVRSTTFGRDRVGGSFEIHQHVLWTFGGAGLVTRSERWDLDREAEALARLDALTVEPPAVQAVRRRVRPNAATRNQARFVAAFAARDADGIAELHADPTEHVYHPTGTTHDRHETLATYREALAGDQRISYRHEPLASLGESVALFRLSITGPGGALYGLDTGPVGWELLSVIEVDSHGRRRRLEAFAADRLGDAIARLYERYAEGLTEGPEQTRAAATARSVARVPHAFPSDLDSLAAVLAPDVEFVDHRPLGLPSRRGAKEFLDHQGTLFELASDLAVRIDDVLALRPDALLGRWVNSGRLRAGGGAFERVFLFLDVFGVDGLLARRELFDPDSVAEALARFDELTAEPSKGPRVLRRVRPNAAAALCDRFAAAVSARDAAALEAAVPERFENVHHPSGVSLGRSQFVQSWRSAFEAGQLRRATELIATLGESLALGRESIAITEADDRIIASIGPAQIDGVFVAEDDGQGRARLETFSADHLGDAIVRLYERYAEGLREGPEKMRAAATARSVAVVLGPYDLDLYAAVHAPAIEYYDHRVPGVGSLTGIPAVRQWFGSLLEIAEDVANRYDDVLALCSDALLLRWTNSGTERIGGGRYERHFLWLALFGPDGLVTRIELFDAGRAAEALARFDELTAVAEPARRVARPVRPNAAVGNLRAIEAAFTARDAGAFEHLVAADARSLDHTTGLELDRSRMLRSWRSFLDAEDFRLAYEPLATLGDTLALARSLRAARGVARGSVDLGAYESESIHLSEVDAEGRRRWGESFPTRRLGDAVARLYERYAEGLPEGSERERATVTARSVAAMLIGPFDPDRYAAAFELAIEAIDHRTLGTHSGRGAGALREVLRSWLAVADLTTVRSDAVLGLRRDALLEQIAVSGTDRAGGGVFERGFLRLLVFGAGGLIARIEWFDADREAEALARFDALTAEPPATPFANGAWRALQRFERCWRERDWDGALATYDPAHQMDDRRKLMRLRVSGADFVANERMLFEETASEWRSELLATRGDRLALARVRFTAEAGGSGPMTVEVLDVVEVDAAGRRIALVVFDADDLDAAYAALDARFDEATPDARSFLDGLRRQTAAVAARDWDEVARMGAPDFRLEDHRLLGWGGGRSHDELLARARSLIDLAPDTALRVDHVLGFDERRALIVVRWVGSQAGGSFEIPFIVVASFAKDRRLRAIHSYDLDQLALARARYAELGAAPRTAWVENAATRAMQRAIAVWEARDWEAFAAGFAAGFRSTDRRRLIRLELDRDWIASYRELLEMTTGFSLQVLATRGERLALARAVWEGAGPESGPSEIESLAVVEVDEQGDTLALVEFDAEDLDAAYAELDERYGTARPPIPFLRARAAQDWDALEALLAPDLVHEDHRRLGHETRRGPAEYIAFMQTLVDLAPDARLHADHIEDRGQRALVLATLRGTWEGGAFEMSLVVVGEEDAQGRTRRLDVYDPEQLDEARARLRAPAADAPVDPLAALVRPNAASAHMDRAYASLEARDWVALRALAAPGARFEDRRGHALVSGDLDWLVEYLTGTPFDVSLGSYRRTLVASAGDHVCLERVLWAGGPADGRVEIEYLWLAEVDENGRLVAGVMFDVDDRRAAVREASTRWLARDAVAAAVLGPALELTEAWNDRDGARMRAVLADDLVVHNHRLVGQGRVDGAEAHLGHQAVTWELAPDIEFEPCSVLALERHGAVVVSRSFGTISDGGGTFDRHHLQVIHVARGRVTRIDSFDLEQLDAALARLAEPRPDPLRIPPNAATRVAFRWQEAITAGDLESVTALFAPTLVYEDRTRRSLVSVDRELLLAKDRLVAASRPSISRTVLATAGDRLALSRVSVAGTYQDGAFEAEILQLNEVDADGRLVAAIAFDPDDRRAASRELLERWARCEAGHWLRGSAVEFRRALFDRDLARARAVLDDAFVFDDHRRTGLGRVEGADRYVASLAALHEESPDVVIEPLYYVAVEPHGHLAVTRRFGTLAEGGGDFESVFVRMEIYEGDQIVAAELFEPEDLELARARFEALRPDPTGPRGS